MKNMKIALRIRQAGKIDQSTKLIGQNNAINQKMKDKKNKKRLKSILKTTSLIIQAQILDLKNQRLSLNLTGANANS